MTKITKKSVKRTVKTSTSKKKAKRAVKLFPSKKKAKKAVKKLSGSKKKAKKAVKSTVRTPIVKKVKVARKPTPQRLKRSGKKSKSSKGKKKPVTSNKKRTLKNGQNNVSSNSPAKNSSGNSSERVADEMMEEGKIRSRSPSNRSRKRAASVLKSPMKRSAKSSKKRSGESPKKRSSKRKRSAPKPTSSKKKRNVSPIKASTESSNVNEAEFLVEKICDIQFRNGEEHCLVKWKGLGMEENTWEPLQNLGNASEAIEDFYAEQVYEVEYVCGIRRVGGKREYFVKWKGWPASSNTWEPRESLMEGAEQEVMKFEKISKTRTA